MSAEESEALDHATWIRSALGDAFLALLANMVFVCGAIGIVALPLEWSDARLEAEFYRGIALALTGAA